MINDAEPRKGRNAMDPRTLEPKKCNRDGDMCYEGGRGEGKGDAARSLRVWGGLWGGGCSPPRATKSWCPCANNSAAASETGGPFQVAKKNLGVSSRRDCKVYNRPVVRFSRPGMTEVGGGSGKYSNVHHMW